MFPFGDSFSVNSGIRFLDSESFNNVFKRIIRIYMTNSW